MYYVNGRKYVVSPYLKMQFLSMIVVGFKVDDHIIYRYI